MTHCQQQIRCNGNGLAHAYLQRGEHPKQPLTDLLAGAAVVEHHVGERGHAVRAQRSDARAQLRLAAVRGVQALILARQVPLRRNRRSW